MGMQIRDIKYMFGYQKIIKVDDRLSRGSAVFTPVRAARLKLKGVEQIVDLRGGTKAGSSFLQSLEQWYCKIFNIKYINIPLSFSQKSIPKDSSFQKVVEVLDKDSSKTYIHCHYGRHRTGECIALYQKKNNQKEENILHGLMEYGWNKKEDFLENSYQSLLLFLKTYFPNKNNLKIVEKYRVPFAQ